MDNGMNYEVRPMEKEQLQDIQEVYELVTYKKVPDKTGKIVEVEDTAQRVTLKQLENDKEKLLERITEIEDKILAINELKKKAVK